MQLKIITLKFSINNQIHGNYVQEESSFGNIIKNIQHQSKK